MQRTIFRTLLKIAAPAFLLGAAPLPRWAAEGMPWATGIPSAGMPGLSIMTYNVEGLPWPMRVNRQDDFDAMTAQLQRMRREGRQPHVIVLQEAFSDGARRISRDTGYRYIANGPSRDDVGVAQPRPADANFLDGARWSKGEREGKWLGSGLQIASDYPILSVARAPFPAFACAGFDCLANKGMLAVTIAVPGMTSPVTVIDLHLNSRKASGVDNARSLQAYRLQVDALTQFITHSVPAHRPLIISGDFNIGKSVERKNYVVSSLARLSDNGAPLSDALTTCSDDRSMCPSALPSEAQLSMRRGKDWQFYRASPSEPMQVRHIAVPFGHADDRSMLSDHIGYTAYYGRS